MNYHIKHNTYLCLVLNLITVSHIAYGMFNEEELGDIEKEIFFNEIVNKIGTKETLDKIHKTKDTEYNVQDHSVTSYTCFSVTTIFRPPFDTSLAQRVNEAVEKQESKFNPQKQSNEQFAADWIRNLTQMKNEEYRKERLQNYILSYNQPKKQHSFPNTKHNHIDYFTRYYVKEDEQGKYIKLKSNFDSKYALLQALNNK